MFSSYSFLSNSYSVTILLSTTGGPYVATRCTSFSKNFRMSFLAFSAWSLRSIFKASRILAAMSACSFCSGDSASPRSYVVVSCFLWWRRAPCYLFSRTMLSKWAMWNSHSSASFFFRVPGLHGDDARPFAAAASSAFAPHACIPWYSFRFALGSFSLRNASWYL